METVQSLLQDRAERVAQLSSQLQEAESKNEESLAKQGPALNIAKKMSCNNLWNVQDYEIYLSTLTDERQIEDMKKFFSVLKEGNDAIIKKENPGGASLMDSKERKRSRSVNNDLYRSRVAEGMRNIVYRFMLSPFRAGIKLEEMANDQQFDYERQLPGEENDEDAGQPARWNSPKVEMLSPTEFANDLIGSGELVQIMSSDTSADVGDPLSGCRFVCAMEIAYEPRIRKFLRHLFRTNAVITTRPTKKGLDNIDFFSEYYGLHLIKGKPVRDHFPVDDKEREMQKMRMSLEEGKEYDKEMERKEKESCLQYVRILEAEHFGHISLHVHLPYLQSDPVSWFNEKQSEFANRENQETEPLMRALQDVFNPVEMDTDEWNGERKKVLEFALMKVILPELEQETRRDLRDAATKHGVIDAGNNLRMMAIQGPYRPTSLMGENRFIHPTKDLPMVGVCCSTDRREAMYLASVTKQGDLNDHLAIPSGQKIDDNRVRNKVIEFLMNSRPSAVLVGTSGGFTARFITRRLGELIARATERWNNRFIQGADEDDDDYENRKRGYDLDGRDDDDETWKCNVELVDDSVSQLFGRSVRAKKEFQDKEVNLKCAISIARQGQDPLSELTYAWNVASDAGIFGTEMLYLNIHPLQRLLPKARLLREYERVLCEAVADVGVDINCACNHDHLLGNLSFAPGLGPRKAANLKQNLARMGGAIASRKSILKGRLLDPVVYNNAVAFLRVREIEQSPDESLHPLDNTRLHPDVYHRNNWAVKIAIDALERVESTKEKESFERKSLEIVMQNSHEEVEKLFKDTKMEWEQHYGPTFDVSAWDPRKNVPSHAWKDKVEELDLDAFARMIENTGLGKWDSHLQMIKWEFRLPYEDPRKPMAPLNGGQLFNLITGESDTSLRPGVIVTGKIVKNGDFGSRVKLEGEIPAFIPLRSLADEHVEAAEDIVQVGSIVSAVITEVKKDHFTVDMSMRMEDLKKPPSSWERPKELPSLDDYFDNTAALRIEQSRQAERDRQIEDQNNRAKGVEVAARGKTGRYSRRACAHPAFRNAKHDEVDRELRDAGEAMVGEALIRPSSKSSDSLAVHWVVKAGSIKMIEVQESEKDTEASIGKILKVKEQVYESIDELLGRHISPMNDHVESLINHRKFLDLPEDEVDEKLTKDKKENPSGVFYHVCWLEMHPGYASLRYILSQNPKHYTIGITPGGFSLGSKVFPKLDLLLNEFKKNPRGMSSSRSTTSSSAATKSRQQTAVEPSRQSRWDQSNGRPMPPASRPPPPLPPAVSRPPPPPVPYPTNLPPPVSSKAM